MKTETMWDPEHLGLRVVRRSGRDEVIVYCPFHLDDHPSAEYNVAKSVFHCFGCKESRTAKELATELGGTLTPIGSSWVSSERRSKGEDTEWLHLLRNPYALDNEYLAGRQVTNEQVIKYEIRENSEGIIFPLRRRSGDLCGFQVRYYTRQPKYLFYGRRSAVWPWPALSPDGTNDTVFVTEGIFGVLRAELAGLKAVAMMGSGGVTEVVRILRFNTGIKPIAVMDPDFAGLLAAGKFVLMGIPALLTLEPCDEWSKSHWVSAAAHIENGMMITTDVNDVIDVSDQPLKLEAALKKFYKKLTREKL